jgi:D-hydroxyproline dehydrogenase subunit beta
MTSAQLAYHRNAVDAYRALAEDDADIDYRRHGGLVIGDPASDAERREAVAPLRAAGFEAEWLDRADLAELEPALSPSIEGAVRLADLATVSPMKVVGELVRRANRRGASILVETEFQGVRRAKGRLSSVLTSRGAIATEWLVIAAGAWSRQAGRLVGLQVPVWPLKGHVLVTEPAWGLIGHYLSDAGYEASVEAIRATPLGADGPESGGPAVLASVIQPLPSGSYLIGSSREFAGFDRDVDRHRLEELADRARRIVPALAGLRVLRAYAGLRPWSPDGRPMVGRTAAFEGVALATGHAGDGNTGALITGRLLASDLTGTPPVVDLAPYAPDRFDLERGHEDTTRSAPSPRSTESR